MQKIFTTLAVFVLAHCFTNSASADWATLRGRFVYGTDASALPKQVKLVASKDVEVCGKQQLFNERLVVNAENRGIANVVLWAYKPKSVHPSYQKLAGKKVTVANVACRFEPHITTLSTSQILEVANPDAVAHNAMIHFLKNRSENPLIPAFGKVDLRLKKSEIIPVSISCSIHPWMQAKILVQDHPYMAVTDKNGKFELKNLPSGKLTLKVWHESTGYIQGVELDNKPTAWKKGKYAINLAADAIEEHTYRVDPKLFAKK
jgi:hypothetical protein